MLQVQVANAYKHTWKTNVKIKRMTYGHLGGQLIWKGGKQMQERDTDKELLADEIIEKDQLKKSEMH